MNKEVDYDKKNKLSIKAMKIESEQLLKEIESEPDSEKVILLIRDYNNLCMRIDSEENFMQTDKKKKPLIPSYQRVERRLSKRCG